MILRESLKLWDEACKAYDDYKYGEADVKFQRIFRSQPTAKISFNIGRICGRQGSLDKAIQYFQDALSLDEHLIVAYFELAIAEIKLGRYSEAALTLRQAYLYTKMCPTIDYRQLGLDWVLHTAQLLLNLALCYARLGEPTEAEKWLDWAKSVDTDGTFASAVDTALYKVRSHQDFDLQELPVNAIFRPSKSVVSNIDKQDHLGTSRVVSSTTTAGAPDDDDDVNNVENNQPINQKTVPDSRYYDQNSVISAKTNSTVVSASSHSTTTTTTTTTAASSRPSRSHNNDDAAITPVRHIPSVTNQNQAVPAAKHLPPSHPPPRLGETSRSYSIGGDGSKYSQRVPSRGRLLKSGSVQVDCRPKIGGRIPPKRPPLPTQESLEKRGFKRDDSTGNS